MLFGQWLVPMPLAPFPYAAHEAAQPLALGLAFDGPPATKRFRPVVSKSQKGEAARSFPALPIRPAELHQPAFLRVDTQPIPLEPLGQDSEYPLSLSFHAEPHDEVIRIAHQKAVPFHPRSDFPLEPLVQYFVQKGYSGNLVGRNPKRRLLERKSMESAAWVVSWQGGLRFVSEMRQVALCRTFALVGAGV